MIVLDLDRRTAAMIELLRCPVRWSSKQYVFALSTNLQSRCDEAGRSDLSSQLQFAMDEVTLNLKSGVNSIS